VFVLAVFKKQAAHAFLGCKILSTVYNWRAVGWIEGEIVKRNVNRRMKIGCI
jgi:hypothetical protein